MKVFIDLEPDDIKTAAADFIRRRLTPGKGSFPFCHADDITLILTDGEGNEIEGGIRVYWKSTSKEEKKEEKQAE